MDGKIGAQRRSKKGTGERLGLCNGRVKPKVNGKSVLRKDRTSSRSVSQFGKRFFRALITGHLSRFDGTG